MFSTHPGLVRCSTQRYWFRRDVKTPFSRKFDEAPSPLLFPVITGEGSGLLCEALAKQRGEDLEDIVSSPPGRGRA